MDVGLVVLGAPVWGAVLGAALAVTWLDTGHPLLFSHVRMGKDQRPFRIYKLRTMHRSTPPPKGALFSGWTYAGDPRITRSGRFFRRYRLDELPQLFNVLRGDMSLVGPRPEPWEVAVALGEQIPGYHGRHHVLPGLTGLCQISPRYSDFGTVAKSAAKAELDLVYMRTASVKRDVAILLKTLGVVLRGEGIA